MTELGLLVLETQISNIFFDKNKSNTYQPFNIKLYISSILDI